MTGTETTGTRDRERRYRRLLRVYPRWYRESRGEEMVTTLLDVAEARGSASAWENLTIFLRGLRLRLVAGSVSSGCAAAAAAVLMSVLGATAGAVTGWQNASDLPGRQESAAIAETAVPGAEAESVHGFVFGWEQLSDESQPLIDPGGDDYRAGFREFSAEFDTTWLDLLRQARSNLSKAGWDVDPISPERYGGEFSATRGEVFVTVSSGDGSHTVYIERVQPTAVPLLATAGMILGAMSGWTVLVWLHRRMAHWGGIRKSVLGAPLATAGLALMLPTLFNLLMLAYAATDLSRPNPIWLGYVWGPTSLLTLIAAAALAFGLLRVLLALLRPPRRTSRQLA